MSVLSRDEIRQREHCEFVLVEMTILNLAEKSLTFFGLSKEIMESNTYKKITEKRNKLLILLARHTYIIDKIRHEDYTLELLLDLEAGKRNREREQEKFYEGFSDPSNFEVNDKLERDIKVLNSYLYN